jgi:hypothetical protein
MESTMGTLETVAEKELNGEAFTEAEGQFLNQVLFYGPGGCASVEKGWYRDLYFGGGDYATSARDLLVADVHTAPTDAAGNTVGHVLHAATGYPEMGFFVATPPGGEATVYAGPVGTYHDYVTSGFLRLTDDEWRSLYWDSPPLRPDWTYVYLADKKGNSREYGRRLVGGQISGIPEDDPVAPTLEFAQNHPNPFSGSTLFSFRVDGSRSNSVVLDIMDTRGRLVRRLLEDELVPNTYHLRWDGTDDRGASVAVGIYFAHLRVENETATRKLTVLR